MRYLKLSSAKNPDGDFIELNDLQGFLCTSFRNIGISRSFEFLSIGNRQFAVDNKTKFNKYSLTIEILSKYSEYEQKHRELISFLDRNKKYGFRLYYRPYNGMDLRYCLCDIESSIKTEKMQPVVLTLSQGSLWLGEEKTPTTELIAEDEEGMFVFAEDNGYYSTSFSFDDETGLYRIEFYANIFSSAYIVNDSYNEIPLSFKIYGPCESPFLSLYKKGEGKTVKELQVLASIDKGYYIEVNSKIGENGIWYVNTSTGEKVDYTELINNELGSPYFYIEHGEYEVRVTDLASNVCITNIFYQEEYS